MRATLAARGTPAAIVGVIVLLAAGGGYAIASGGKNRTIRACVHKHGHGLYVGKCAKHDKKLSWNQVGPPGSRGATGPQGPGARKLVYDASGSPFPPTTPIGNMGPYSVSASCAQPSPGTTNLQVTVSGPAGKLDGLVINGSSPAAVSATLPPISNAPLFAPGGETSTSTTASTDAANAVWLPSSGTSVETQLTASATGSTTNTCHFSAAITPLS